MLGVGNAVEFSSFKPTSISDSIWYRRRIVSGSAHPWNNWNRASAHDYCHILFTWTEDARNTCITKPMYVCTVEYKNFERERPTSSATQLTLRYRSYPRHEQISRNSNNTYDPEHPSVIRAAVAIDQQEDDAAQVARCAGHTRDETCEEIGSVSC